jgi:hypothetical protein
MSQGAPAGSGSKVTGQSVINPENPDLAIGTAAHDPSGMGYGDKPTYAHERGHLTSEVPNAESPASGGAHDSSSSTGATGAGATGATDTGVTGGTGSTTAPHGSNLLDKLDPRVDSSSAPSDTSGTYAGNDGGATGGSTANRTGTTSNAGI